MLRLSWFSKHLNRRRMSVALGSVGIAIGTTVVPIARLRATDDQPTEPVSRRPQQRNEAVSHKADLSTGISWGRPSDGLRAALVVHRAWSEPDANEDLDFYLAVQNVSNQFMDLNHSADVPIPFELTIKSRGATQFHLKNNTSLPGFVRLAPRSRVDPPDVTRQQDRRRTACRISDRPGLDQRSAADGRGRNDTRTGPPRIVEGKTGDGRAERSDGASSATEEHSRTRTVHQVAGTCPNEHRHSRRIDRSPGNPSQGICALESFLFGPNATGDSAFRRQP